MIGLSQNFWEKYFKVYDVLNKVEPYQTLLKLILDKLPNINKLKVLDLGSGTGNLSVLLKNHGYEVYSLDYSHIGKKIHKQKDPTAKVYLHNLTSLLPFDNNYFDIIISLNTLCYIDKDKRLSVFIDLNRILKSGGKIIVVNLLTKFRAISVLITHVKKYYKKYGIFKTLVELTLVIIPAIKMFYFTIKIKKNTKKIPFFGINEQYNYLNIAGFHNISENEKTFAEQAVLNEAYK